MSIPDMKVRPIYGTHPYSTRAQPSVCVRLISLPNSQHRRRAGDPLCTCTHMEWNCMGQTVGRNMAATPMANHCVGFHQTWVEWRAGDVCLALVVSLPGTGRQSRQLSPAGRAQVGQVRSRLRPAGRPAMPCHASSAWAPSGCHSCPSKVGEQALKEYYYYYPVGRSWLSHMQCSSARVVGSSTARHSIHATAGPGPGSPHSFPCSLLRLLPSPSRMDLLAQY